MRVWEYRHVPFFAGVSGQVFFQHRRIEHSRGDGGRGRPDAEVVLLHGLGQHSGDYHGFSRLLGTYGIETWALDHVGHGMTEGALGETGLLDDLVENARRLTSMVSERIGGGQPPVLVGHSLGAVVAAEVAMRDPGLCAGLVLSGVPFVPTDTERPSARGRVSADARSRRQATDDVRRRFSERPAPVPTLVLHGGDDRIVPVDGVRAQLGGREDVDLVVFGDAGHDLPHEPVRKRVADVIAGFVLRVSVRPR